jgi:hypothetical protein
VIRIEVGDRFTFTARLETAAAPKTCAAFVKLLPYRQRLIHARWSGEACWIPLGGFDLGVGPENATSHPSRGEILWYPGGASETELLFTYGDALFASKVGQLAGNRFLTIVAGAEQLPDMGKTVLYEGAQDIAFVQEENA